MTVDDSTPDETSVPSSPSTIITPPAIQNAPGATLDLRSKDQLLASLKAEVRMLRSRVDALEAERRRFAQATSTDTASSSSTSAANEPTATPRWRTKNGKQTGWQPARR